MTAKAKTPSNKALQRFVNEGGTTRAGELARNKSPRDANQLGKSIVDIATGETEDRGDLKGGKARAASMSAKQGADTIDLAGITANTSQLALQIQSNLASQKQESPLSGTSQLPWRSLRDSMFKVRALPPSQHDPGCRCASNAQVRSAGC